jgi:hypothetical protein
MLMGHVPGDALLHIRMRGHWMFFMPLFIHRAMNFRSQSCHVFQLYLQEIKRINLNGFDQRGRCIFFPGLSHAIEVVMDRIADRYQLFHVVGSFFFIKDQLLEDSFSKRFNLCSKASF